MSAIRAKLLKVNFDHLYFPNAKHCNDGSMGREIENELRRQGFNVRSDSVIDMPDLLLEIKTRKSSSSAAHTVGTMTHTNILANSWDKTSFKQKLQSQYRVIIDVETGKVGKAAVVHFHDDPDLQNELRKAYEDARSILHDHYFQTGTILESCSIKSSKNSPAFLEYKDGNSYAFRITDCGMKRFIQMAGTAPVFNSLFE
jgi:hypothetical protein